MRARSVHWPLDSWRAHVGSAQLGGGSLSTHSAHVAGVGARVGAIVGALVGARVGKAAGSTSVSQGSSGAAVGADVGAAVGALVGAAVGISRSAGHGFSQGTQMPHVASQ